MNRLTASLITLNEEQNLPRVLASLEGVADEIVVVDCGSTDRTCEIARQHGARVFSKPWTGQDSQRNCAAAHATHDWILALDADEELSPRLRESLRVWKTTPAEKVAYEFPRKASYLGRWILHSGWYPDRKARLYRRDVGHFVGVLHDSLQVEGPVGRLDGELYHHAFRSYAEHADKVNSYSAVAAEEMFLGGRRRWRLAMLLAPPWTLLHTFLIQRAFLDGYRGGLIAWMAARYALLKYRKLGRLERGGSLGAKPRGAQP
jgi:glycosyltransferase involved in cell wall biosynthesis